MMAGPCRDHMTVDIVGVEKSLASSIQNMKPENSIMSTKCCIFKIPNILYRHNEKAFLPNAFSFGPIHHCNPNLKATEQIKLHYLVSLISRSPLGQTSLKNFITAVGNLEREARECYAVPVDFSVDEFVSMLVLDGCFIIELLHKNAVKNAGKVLNVNTNDPVFDTSCMLQYLHHDLVLLENQIPWLVLDCLFEMTKAPTEKFSLAELAHDFFYPDFSFKPLPTVGANHGSKHILDLLRNMLVVPLEGRRGELVAKWELIPSATSLKEAGIKFKKGDSNNVLDIEFRDEMLVIPPLVIQETTNDAIRNLIAFEQCYHKCTAKITSWAILLDNLVNTSKDIDVLRGEGIIENWLNPEDAIQFFNKLYHDTYVNQFYYLELCHQVNNICRRKWPRWRAMLVRNHFGNPWAIVSLFVAGIVVALTLLQTIFTVKS